MARHRRPRPRLALALDAERRDEGGDRGIPEPAAQELIDAELEWARIVVERDLQAAAGFLADDFELLSEGGVSRSASRDQWLAALPSIESAALDVVDTDVRLLGDVAAVRARLHWDARMGERDLTGDYVVADVFTRAPDGRWRAAWRVSTKVSG